ncbi:MAG: hypothetical protein IT372_24640 [Polyangiaceae bacterium]|nr:hypothetical protein [Polyangiaceae bacterium]
MDPHGAPHQAANYPPGGYGPPPGGGYGPPPGGGYGPPPGGGFGGPPPGGGFGGPPPGGGFGGPPPGGGFGGPPPGGFGPPGYGPPRPPQRKSNLGLFIGLGCGALVLIGAIIAAIALIATRKAAQEITSTTPAPGPGEPQPGTQPAPVDPSLRAELRDLRDFKGSGSLRRFVGEIHNTGTGDIGFPIARITLLDASNTAIDSGTCASIVRVLPPGEKVPCTFVTTKSGYKSYRSDITPMRSFFRGQLAKLAITETKFTPKVGFNPYLLEGKLTNQSPFTAKTVTALVAFYGKDGRIVGADQALVAGNDLPPGATGRFTSRIFDVAEPPETWQVLALGYSE